MAHQRRRKRNALANVKFTTSQTIPRTASQLTSPITMIQYQESRWPASSIKVRTAATVRLGSRRGLIKSKIRQSHCWRPIFAFNVGSSRSGLAESPQALLLHKGLPQPAWHPQGVPLHYVLVVGF